jgi:2-oxoglutarate/2-oxoacid ferredoxin oxidoreductase subunit alpha
LKTNGNNKRQFITGNQAIVQGAIRAGCNYVAGYPITPASSILNGFIRAFDGTENTVVQTEDEIAAIGQCIGATMAGAKALTATSGPGISLYSENIGLAQMGEVPLVIVDCQRMGPATGGATATGDGDVIFARHVTSGGYPLPVLAAADVATAYRLTYEAFNIAERFRTPVMLLASKDISLTRQTVELDNIDLPPITARSAADPNEPFEPYAFDALDQVPAFAPIGGPQRVRFTGSIHDEHGVLTTDKTKIERKLSHLKAKIDSHRDELEYVDHNPDERADTLIISYGTVDGAARDAVSTLRASGERIAHLTLYSLWPMPERAIRKAVTDRIRRVVVPELNIGLYADELRKVIHSADIESVQRFDGGLIHPRRIVHHVVRSPCG